MARSPSATVSAGIPAASASAMNPAADSSIFMASSMFAGTITELMAVASPPQMIDHVFDISLASGSDIFGSTY